MYSCILQNTIERSLRTELEVDLACLKAWLHSMSMASVCVECWKDPKGILGQKSTCLDIRPRIKLLVV